MTVPVGRISDVSVDGDISAKDLTNTISATIIGTIRGVVDVSRSRKESRISSSSDRLETSTKSGVMTLLSL